VARNGKRLGLDHGAWRQLLVRGSEGIFNYRTISHVPVNSVPLLHTTNFTGRWSIHARTRIKSEAAYTEPLFAFAVGRGAEHVVVACAPLLNFAPDRPAAIFRPGYRTCQSVDDKSIVVFPFEFRIPILTEAPIVLESDGIFDGASISIGYLSEGHGAIQN